MAASAAFSISCTRWPTMAAGLVCADLGIDGLLARIARAGATQFAADAAGLFEDDIAGNA